MMMVASVVRVFVARGYANAAADAVQQQVQQQQLQQQLQLHQRQAQQQNINSNEISWFMLLRAPWADSPRTPEPQNRKQHH